MKGGKQDSERFVSMVRGGGCPCNVSTQVSDCLTEGSRTVADSSQGRLDCRSMLLDSKLRG